jgi:nucleotide-binding universal stress UspA family protein
MTVVVGYTANAEGEAALRHGMAEAVVRTEDLVVVYTSRTDFGVDSSVSEEEQLSALQEVLDGSGLEHQVVHVARRRDSADEILSAIDDHDASLVVIGLKRRTPLGKLLLGSTAQRVLLEAECPVVAVKKDLSASAR